MWDDIADLYSQGVQDYSGGYVPDGWNVSALRDASPYLMGWYQASMYDTGQTDLDERNQ